MNFSISSLVAGFIFGTFGIYFVKQGKRQGNLQAIFIGVVLFVFPYFVENPFLLWGMGIGTLVLGFRSV